MSTNNYPLDNECTRFIETQRMAHQKKLGVRIPKAKFSRYWLLPNLKRIESGVNRRVNANTK